MMHRTKRVVAVSATFAALALPVGATAQPNQAAGQINQGNLISALNNVAVQVDRVNALNDLTIEDVQVVNVQDVIRNSRVLNNALRDADIDVLTDFLNNSVNNNNVEILNDVLNANDVAINDLVAVNVLSGGDVVLFEQ
jgi:ABC-type antimicrobial peptide transport system permease subunit